MKIKDGFECEHPTTKLKIMAKTESNGDGILRIIKTDEFPYTTLVIKVNANGDWTDLITDISPEREYVGERGIPKPTRPTRPKCETVREDKIMMEDEVRLNYKPPLPPKEPEQLYTRSKKADQQTLVLEAILKQLVELTKVG